MSEYCTLDQARDAGATGSETELHAAISAASDRVTRFTHELFAETQLTIVRPIAADGCIYTHTRIVDVAAVRYVGWATPIDVTSYRVLSSSVDGQVDAIILAGTLAWSDITVLGAEPWNGGWANLMYGNSQAQPQVEIDGTFGWTVAPVDVAEATARIAAVLRRSDKTPEASSEDSSAVDDEGNVIPVVPPFSTAASDVAQLVRTRVRTTGSRVADDLLMSYVREPVRIRA